MFARSAALAALALLTTAASPSPFKLPAGTPVAAFLKACDGKDGWNDRAPPIKVFANVYYVGTCGIASLLIVSPEGDVLIDSGSAEAAPGLIANLLALGQNADRVKWIVTSHEHLDHVGGVAQVKKATGAQLAARLAAKGPLERGAVDWRDPQAGSIKGFAGVKVDRVLADGEHLVIGSIDLTAHATPGHSPGSTSWTWRACEGAICRDMAYVDSVSAVSADTYKFATQGVYVDAFARSLGKIASLPCEILITPHPGASGFFARLAGKAPLVDRQACLTYAEAGQAALEKRIKDESART